MSDSPGSCLADLILDKRNCKAFAESKFKMDIFCQSPVVASTIVYANRQDVST